MPKQKKTLADCDVDEIYKWWASLDDDQRKLKTISELMVGVFGVRATMASISQYVKRHDFKERLDRQIRAQTTSQITKSKRVVAAGDFSIDNLGTTIDLIENCNVQLNMLIDAVVKSSVRIANNKRFSAFEAVSLLTAASDTMMKTAEIRALLMPLSKKTDTGFGVGVGSGGDMNEGSAEIYSFFQSKSKKT